MTGRSTSTRTMTTRVERVRRSLRGARLAPETSVTARRARRAVRVAAGAFRGSAPRRSRWNRERAGRTLGPVARCPRCGWENPGSSRFCGNCGARLEPAPAGRSERKVVTVLFADLVGFTARSEQLDPEEVAAFLQPYHARVREELERFGGTVEKFIGDAVMALFGAPIAHEDDPERAVRAALAIQDRMAGDGETSMSGSGSTPARRSSRSRHASQRARAWPPATSSIPLPACRRPLRWTASSSARRRTARPRVVEYRPAEPVAAKGKTEPVRAWEPVRVRARAERGPATPFVGRSDARSARARARRCAYARRAPARHRRRPARDREDPSDRRARGAPTEPHAGSTAGRSRTARASRTRRWRRSSRRGVDPLQRRRGPGGGRSSGGSSPRRWPTRATATGCSSTCAPARARRSR